MDVPAPEDLAPGGLALYVVHLLDEGVRSLDEDVHLEACTSEPGPQGIAAGWTAERTCVG